MNAGRAIGPQLHFYLICAAGALLLTLVPELMGTRVFEPYLGDFSPTIALGVVMAAGWVALWLLKRTEPLSSRWAGACEGLHWAAAAGLVFGAVLIPVDLVYRLPAELNAPFPGSLILYPVLCLALEVIFHLVPFAVLYLVLSKILVSRRPFTAVVIAAAVAAATEPVYQISLPFLGSYPFSLSLIVLLFSALFNAAQLFSFVRHGFPAMMTLRLVQYIVWHIVWGVLRLRH